VGCRPDHVQLGRLGREIENRYLEPVVVDIEHSDGPQQTPIPIGQGGAPGIDESSAIGETPDEWDVRMPGHSDIHPPPEMPLEQRGNVVFRAVLSVLKIMGESDADTLDLDYDDVRDARVIGDARGSKPRVITVPSTDECGCDTVEAIHDVDGVEIAAVENTIAARQYVICLRGKICARGRNVGVTNEPDTDCHRLMLSRSLKY